MRFNKFIIVVLSLLSILSIGLIILGLILSRSDDQTTQEEFSKPEKKEELYDSIINVEKDEYKQYLDNGDQLEFTFEDGTTPLDKFVEISDIESAQKILDSGFNLKDVENNHIDTVSNVVFYNDDHDNEDVDAIVIQLINQIKDELDEPDKWGLSLLINAVSTNRVEVVKEILKHDIEINRDYEGLSALTIACGTTDIDLEIIQLLVENGADVNAVDEDGNNSMFWAIDYGQTYIVRYLLESTNIDVNHQNNYGDTALHHSIYSDTIDIADLLMYHNIDITIKNNNNETAKDLASKYDYNELADRLSE